MLFLDTGYHFAETYAYRDRMAREWQLNLVNVLAANRPSRSRNRNSAFSTAPNPTQCCQLRKVEPLMRRLSITKSGSPDCAANNRPRAKISKWSSITLAQRQNAAESEPAGRLDLGASVELHRRE